MRVKHFSWRCVELTWPRHSIGWSTGHKWEWHGRYWSRRTAQNDNHFIDTFLRLGPIYFWHSELVPEPLWLAQMRDGWLTEMRAAQRGSHEL